MHTKQNRPDVSSVPPTRSETYTRIGVIGDIHTRGDRLEWAVQVLKKQSVEALFATGDIVDGPNPERIASICASLREHHVATVLGNHDRWLLDGVHRDLKDATFSEDVDAPSRAFLSSLPQSIELPTPCGLALFGHGLGSNDMTRLTPYDRGYALSNNETLQKILQSARYRFVIGGHTHLRMVRSIAGVMFINAGALHYTREPCCLVLDFAARRAQFFEYAEDQTYTLGPGYEL